MAVEVLASAGGHTAVMFCNTTDWAFGPVFTGDTRMGLSGEDEAHAFIAWLEAREGLDPREPSERQLGDLYERWRKSVSVAASTQHA